MDATTLGEYKFPDERFIGGNPDSGERFHYFGNPVKFLLFHVGFHFQVVLYCGDHTGERRIARSFAQSIDCCVDTPDPSLDGMEHIGNGQVVIVMGMEVEGHIRIGLNHFPAIVIGLIRIEDA